MPHAPSLAPDQLRDPLLRALDTPSTPRVTIGLPVKATWERTRHAKLQLRTLVDKATDTMDRYGLTPEDPAALLAPATALLDETDFWASPADGVLFLLGPEGPETSVVQRLPFSPAPFVAVDTRYHVRSIWSYLEPDLRFYVLALSAGGVQLYRASRYTMEPVVLPDVPTSLEEALQYDDPIRSVRYHTKTPPGANGDPSRRAAVYYGHADAGDRAYVQAILAVDRSERVNDKLVRKIMRGGDNGLPGLDWGQLPAFPGKVWPGGIVNRPGDPAAGAELSICSIHNRRKLFVVRNVTRYRFDGNTVNVEFHCTAC